MPDLTQRQGDGPPKDDDDEGGLNLEQIARPDIKDIQDKISDVVSEEQQDQARVARNCECWGSW